MSEVIDTGKELCICGATRNDHELLIRRMSVAYGQGQRIMRGQASDDCPGWTPTGRVKCT